MLRFLRRDEGGIYQHYRRSARQQDAHGEEDVERPRRQGGEHKRADHSHLQHKTGPICQMSETSSFKE